mmetsp:Transcript_120172/g.326118  ORF Transcript_120172/g.326118 Transcript_120172/m.326118 type:complete len:213 (-) Transcript_120172:678-1316(-)
MLERRGRVLHIPQLRRRSSRTRAQASLLGVRARVRVGLLVVISRGSRVCSAIACASGWPGCSVLPLGSSVPDLSFSALVIPPISGSSIVGPRRRIRRIPASAKLDAVLQGLAPERRHALPGCQQPLLDGRHLALRGLMNLSLGRRCLRLFGRLPQLRDLLLHLRGELCLVARQGVAVLLADAQGGVTEPRVHVVLHLADPPLQFLLELLVRI